MSDVVADTHAILWYLSDPQRLSSVAKAALMAAAVSGTIYVSAISLVEVAYLVDKGRIPEPSFDLLIQTTIDPAGGVVLTPISHEVARAVRRVPRKVVPDMPDRIIAATALHLGLPLVTADQKIRSSGITTVW